MIKNEFLKFVIVGCVNTLIGVFLATLIAFKLQEVPAFLLGYWISLIISYFLNSKYVFQKEFSFKSMINFKLSYIPNFIIQVATVYFLAEKLDVYPIIIYALSAAISVPITFVMLKLFTFKRNEDNNEENF